MDETVLVVGVRKVSFKDNKTGNMIEGMSIYHMHTNSFDKNLEGAMTGKDFVSNEIYEQMLNALGELTLVDKEVCFSYNRYGRVCGILV